MTREGNTLEELERKAIGLYLPSTQPQIEVSLGSDQRTFSLIQERTDTSVLQVPWCLSDQKLLELYSKCSTIKQAWRGTYCMLGYAQHGLGGVSHGSVPGRD